MTQNQIAHFRAKEEEKHNRATEAENIRHNVVSEFETARHQAASELNEREANRIKAEQNALTREHYERLDSETARHQLAVETETNRSNLASEGLTAESNAIKSREAEIKAMEAETSRINAGTRLQELSETMRHNLANEHLTKALNDSEIALNTLKGLESASHAQLYDAETALNDVNAKKLIKDMELTTAKIKTENANYYSTLADVGLKHSQTERNVREGIASQTNSYANLISSGSSIISSIFGRGGAWNAFSGSNFGNWYSSSTYNPSTGMFQ